MVYLNCILPKKASATIYQMFNGQNTCFNFLWSISFWIILLVKHFSPVLYFIYKPVIWFALQIKWQVSIWSATLGWNMWSSYFYKRRKFLTMQHPHTDQKSSSFNIKDPSRAFFRVYSINWFLFFIASPLGRNSVNQ